MFGLGVFDVPFHSLAGHRSDAAVEVAGAPEGVSPQLLFHRVPHRLPDQPGADTPELLRQLRHTIILAGADEEVAVVRPEFDRVQHDAQILCGPPEAPLAGLSDPSIPEDLPPILRGKLEVKIRLPNTMSPANQLKRQNLSTPPWIASAILY